MPTFYTLVLFLYEVWDADFACNAPGTYYSCLLYKDGSLSDWGTLYKTLYLDKINGTL